MLNHHGLLSIVRVAPHGRSRTREKYVTYALDLRNMLLRLRFPKFILVTEKFLFGKQRPSIFNDLEPAHVIDGEAQNPAGEAGGTKVFHCRALMKIILTCSQVTKGILLREAKREFRVELEEAGIDIEGSDRDRKEEREMVRVFDILRRAKIIVPRAAWPSGRRTRPRASGRKRKPETRCRAARPPIHRRLPTSAAARPTDSSRRAPTRPGTRPIFSSSQANQRQPHERLCGLQV